MHEGTGSHEFEAKIEQGRGGGAFVTIPFDVETVFGAKGRVPVVATFDGEVYRGSIAPMAGHHVLGIVKEIRGKVGTDVGDLVQVVIKRDLEERIVDVPADLAVAMRSDPHSSGVLSQPQLHGPEGVCPLDYLRQDGRNAEASD